MLNKPALIAVLCLAAVASAYAAYHVTREGQGVTGIEPEQGLGVFVVENNIRLAMGIEKTGYQVGETINITFEAKNDGSENLMLSHPRDYGVFVFDVYDENHVLLGVWPGSASCLFHATNIRPGEAHNENLEWDQKVHRFRGGLAYHWENSLGPGRYYIQGWIGGAIYSILRTPLLEITIEEPTTVVLTDPVGDDGGYGDMKEIRLAKEGDNLILTMEVSENIPTWVGLDADIIWDFLIDVNKDNSYDFKVSVGVSVGGLGVSLLDDYYNVIERLSYELLGPIIEIEVPLTKIGDPESFNLRVYCKSLAWGDIYDMVPDSGWVEISFT